jgi:MFS transporter, MHS family, shikimate and dehydroshikimate transport protein
MEISNRKYDVTLEVSRQDVVKVVLASFIGTFIEFYDYFIFGAAAALVFPKLFFSSLPPAVATIVSFATIGVTFVTRPLGAIIFGHYGDTIGRKRMLVLSLTIMGTATFVIGLLPTYQTIGIAAPILLVVIRLLQGVAVGGEWGGATTMVIEYAPPGRRGFYGSFVQLGNVIGLLLSTGVFAVASSLNKDAFLSWGWRPPFLASIVLLAVGIFIRLRLQEPPAFRRLQEKKKSVSLPLMKVLRQYPKAIVIAMGMRLGEVVFGYLIISWILSYATTKLGISSNDVLKGIMIAAAAGIVTFPLFGWLSDLWGRRTIYLFGAVASCVFAFPFFWMINTGSPGVLQLTLTIGYAGILAAQYSLEPAYFAELFDTDVRYTGVSLGSQVGSIVGGFTPTIAAALLAWAGGATWPIAVFLLVSSLLTAISVLVAGETYHRKIGDEN